MKNIKKPERVFVFCETRMESDNFIKQMGFKNGAEFLCKEADIKGFNLIQVHILPSCLGRVDFLNIYSDLKQLEAINSADIKNTWRTYRLAPGY